MNSMSTPEINDNVSKYSDTLGPFVLTLDILELIVAIVAVLINSLAIYILTTKLKLRQSDTILSFILSIFDIFFSILAIINCLILWTTNHSAMLVTSYSQYNGYLYFCLGACMIDSVMLLSLIRFLGIYKQVQFSNRFWVKLSVILTIFNFMLGLIPLIQSQFIVQPSLKYSSVEFNYQNNWSINFYYCLIWIKLIIDMLIITICYFFISLFYYNYLKNYKEEEVEESGKLPKFNWRDLGGIQSDIGSVQLELDNDNDCQRKEDRRMVRRVSDNTIDNTIDNSSAQIRRQSDFYTSYNMNNLIRSTLSKLYIMLIIYTIELLPFFLIQTLFKFLNVPISSALDSIGSLLTQVIPITNPCFVLFFHFETYQELRFFIYIYYYKFFK